MKGSSLDKLPQPHANHMVKILEGNDAMLEGRNDDGRKSLYNRTSLSQGEIRSHRSLEARDCWLGRGSPAGSACQLERL